MPEQGDRVQRKWDTLLALALPLPHRPFSLNLESTREGVRSLPGDAKRSDEAYVLGRPRKTSQPEEMGMLSDGSGSRPSSTDRERDKDHQNLHQNAPFALIRARNALRVTNTDEPDIAAAAISGVTSPTIATGTASAL